MAQTLAAAITEVEGPLFDVMVGYTVKQPEPAPVDDEVAAAFAGLDFGPYRRIARSLSSRYRCPFADAEDAVQDALLGLLIKRSELFREEPEGWMGLLYETSRYRLLAIKEGQGQTDSIEALTELGGDAPFEKASPCVPLSHDGGAEVRCTSPPLNQKEWSRSQIIAALQRFRDYYGRPPRSEECKAMNGLPSTATIYRHFARLGEAVLAAGMVPESLPRRRRAWRPLEAAEVCRSFRRRNGYWPGWVDVKRRPGDLPGTSVMVRCFGGTRSSDVQRGAEAILAGVDSATAELKTA
jgi:DNA-directed RNA polymerase specialized sigma24 family protein